MTNRQLIAEIKRLDSLLVSAAKRAREHVVIVDKLTAASLHVQALIKKLRGKKT